MNKDHDIHFFGKRKCEFCMKNKPGLHINNYCGVKVCLGCRDKHSNVCKNCLEIRKEKETESIRKMDEKRAKRGKVSHENGGGDVC